MRGNHRLNPFSALFTFFPSSSGSHIDISQLRNDHRHRIHLRGRNSPFSPFSLFPSLISSFPPIFPSENCAIPILLPPTCLSRISRPVFVRKKLNTLEFQPLTSVFPALTDIGITPSQAGVIG